MKKKEEEGKKKVKVGGVEKNLERLIGLLTRKKVNKCISILISLDF